LQFAFIIALGFFFSAINVFIRDFGIILPNLLIMLVFAQKKLITLFINFPISPRVRGWWHLPAHSINY
jgi:hypothetical protein